MKVLSQIITVFLLLSCNSQTGSNTLLKDKKNDTVIIHDTILINRENTTQWQQGFGLTHDPDKDSIWGKPVNYYLTNSNCSGIAQDFYYGTFRPSDNSTTAELLSLVTTNDESLRPFYRWCLNKTIVVSDGALGEFIGQPARQYAEKFPKEFFEYMDIDSTGNKYSDWVNAISYSGFYDSDDWENPLEIRKQMIKTMTKNCENCNAGLLTRIEKFVNDCFPLKSKSE